MKDLRKVTGLALLLVTLSVPAWAGDMATPPAPATPPTFTSAADQPAPPASTEEEPIAVTLLNVALAVADFF